MTLPSIDGYSYYISNDSDEERFCIDSSDEEILDEVDVFLYGTSKQKRKALKNLTGDEASSSDEDFEKTMQIELEEKMKSMESSWKKSANTANEATSSLPQCLEGQGPSGTKYYDDIYFDSDEEDKSKRQKLTDDELFYDPKADDEDQKWVDKRKRLQKKKIKSKGSKKHTNGSDATLTCPACMTTLCMDCQRHSLYQNQFRAMFVMNCKVKFDEILHYKEKRRKEFKRHRKRSVQTSQDVISGLANYEGKSRDIDLEGARYHPVKCSICDTEVAVYDSDEVYHFFNILSGPA